MTDDQQDVQAQVALYWQTVLEYEAIDEEIDSLLMKYGGNTDKMPVADFDRYREMARHRDEIQNDMRIMEVSLLPKDSD